MTIRRARPDESTVVASILHEAAEWLVRRGDGMWTEEELRENEIAEEVRAGLYFLAEVDGEPAGTLRFQLSDPIFWPDLEGDDSAFIHRLAVRRHHSGGGVSSAIFSWAIDRTRSSGRTHLRLDCDADRPRLRAMYERAGFRHHSYRQVGQFFVARYAIEIPSLQNGTRPSAISTDPTGR